MLLQERFKDQTMIQKSMMQSDRLVSGNQEEASVYSAMDVSNNEAASIMADMLKEVSLISEMHPAMPTDMVLNAQKVEIGEEEEGEDREEDIVDADEHVPVKRGEEANQV